MFLKLSNVEPEHSVWVRSDLIAAVCRPAGCRYTEITLALVAPAGILAYRVQEEPEAILALLTNTLH